MFYAARYTQKCLLDADGEPRISLNGSFPCEVVLVLTSLGTREIFGVTPLYGCPEEAEPAVFSQLRSVFLTMSA